MRFRVRALVEHAGVHKLSEVEVEAKGRSQAVTEAARQLSVHRDMVVECLNLMPQGGGGSRRG